MRSRQSPPTLARVDPLTERVTIRYRRPPNGERWFDQRVLACSGDCVVTLLEAADVDTPVTVAGEIVLHPGAPVVWFTYPGRWHDIGRFHLRDGTFTGLYANVLTPVLMRNGAWDTTDLFLDVWKGADGRVEILDEDEFQTARECGWIDAATADRARAEADALADAARNGAWPPAPVGEWDLARALGPPR